MARAKISDRNREIAAVAEMGAQQLGQYGEQGKIWAQRLRSDPHAAVAMAKSYGGLGELENQLRRQQHAAQSGLSGVAKASFIGGGAQGLQQAGAGRKSFAEAEQTGLINDLMGGIGGEGGGSPLTGDGFTRYRTAQAIQSGDPDKIAKEQRRLKFGVNWSGQELEKLRGERKKELAYVPDLLNMRSDWRSLDANTRLGAFGLMQIWQRNADPGAVVRGEDIRLLNATGASTMEEALAYFHHLTDKDAMPPDLGQLFKDAVAAQLDEREREAVRAFGSMHRFADDNEMNSAAKKRSIPYRTQLEGLIPAMTLEAARGNEENFVEGDLVRIEGTVYVVEDGKMREAF